MLLTVRDVAKVLHVPENTVEHWAAESGMPAMRIAGQYRFNRTELLEWATIRQIGIDPDVFHLGENEPGEIASLYESIECGGIRQIAVTDRRAVVDEAVSNFDLPASCDRDELKQLFESRGASAWTFVGQGIAIPHPRYPVVLPIAKPLVQLCFIDQKIQFGDGELSLVDTLFVLLSPTVKTHLTLVALLGGALADAQFAEAVKRKAPPKFILGKAKRFNGSFHQETNGR